VSGAILQPHEAGRCLHGWSEDLHRQRGWAPEVA
jgi:hypothetical protein